MNKITHNMSITVFSVLILSSIVLPTDFILMKIAVLGLLFLLLPFNNLLYSKTIFLWTLLFMTIGSLWTLYGGIIGNPGAFRVTTVMIVYPLLFFIMSAIFDKMNDFKIINTILFVSAFLVVIVQISFLLSSYGIFPSVIANFFVLHHPGFAVLDIEPNYIVFTLPNVSSLLFLIPYVTTYILLSEKLKYRYLFLLLLMIILILLTGRRTFFLSYGISIFSFIILSLSLKSYIKTKIMSRIIIFVFIIMLFLSMVVIYYHIDILYYIKEIVSIFNFSSNNSNIVRKNQFFSLLNGISSFPLFGSGAGASVSDVRSTAQPWAYELSYVALIFQYGILGFLVYFSGVLYVIWKMIQIIKDVFIDLEMKKIILSFLVGMISFLVANATNPYLGKFDYMWVIFIPIMLINTYNITRKNGHAK